MTKATNNCVQTLDTIKSRITIHRGLGLSWRQIAALAEFGGSSAGMLSNILNGYEPRTAETRKRLGLPPVAVSVEPCPDCGEAHLVGWCVKVDGPPVKPKPTYNRKPPRTWPSYFKGSQTDIEQVARQLAKYHPEWELVRKER